jgi:hypothetical protein
VHQRSGVRTNDHRENEAEVNGGADENFSAPQVGTKRRRVLLVEVLEYEPLATPCLAARA